MVGVGDVDSFEAPEYACGAIASDNDVVAGVVCGHDASEVGGHAGGVVPRACVAAGLVDAELAGADGGHLVAGLLFLDGGDLDGLGGNNGFAEFDGDDELLARVEAEVFHGSGLVAEVGDAEVVAACGDVGDAEFASLVGVCAVDDGGAFEELKGGAFEGGFGIGVDDGASEGLGKLLGVGLCAGEEAGQEDRKCAHTVDECRELQGDLKGNWVGFMCRFWMLICIGGGYAWGVYGDLVGRRYGDGCKSPADQVQVRPRLVQGKVG